MRLVARGLANKEIAARIGVSERAIEATLTRVYPRLEVTNRSALIALVLSEAGFGLQIARRTSPPSDLGSHADGSARQSRVNLIFQPVRDASGAVAGLLHIGAEDPASGSG